MKDNMEFSYRDLRFNKFLYELKFNPIKSYLESNQDMIINQKNDMMEKVVKWSNEQENNSEKLDAFDVYKTEVLNSDAFPKILNKSICLTIYSMFENEFFGLCEQCKYIDNLKLGPKDLNDRNYVGQCRKYVIKVLNVNLDNLNSLWIKIGNYQLIRNSIAHNNGILKDLKKANLEFINNTVGISVDSFSGEIQIESIEFLKSMIDVLVNFLNQLIDELVNQKEKAGT